MRTRHSITFVTDSLQPDTPIRPEGSSPGLRSDASADQTIDDDGVLDLFGSEPSIDDVELIDRSRAEAPVLPVELSEGEDINRGPRRPAVSPIQASQPVNPSRPQLPWGLGTDGWPRHNSRLVRLFASDPTPFVEGVIGRRWDCLSLSEDWTIDTKKHATTPGWPVLIDGLLQMPYASPPLEVELQVQPFHERYARVDIVLRSHYRWPRRYFDVASVCLTKMQQLERSVALAL